MVDMCSATADKATDLIVNMSISMESQLLPSFFFFFLVGAGGSCSPVIHSWDRESSDHAQLCF